MSHENKVSSCENEAQQRLIELSQGDAADLRDELALCRYLLESAARMSALRPSRCCKRQQNSVRPMFRTAFAATICWTARK